MGLFAAPYIRRFGEDITESAPQPTEQSEPRQPGARHLAPELAASYSHNVPQQCRYPPVPSAFNQQPNGGVVDIAGLLAAGPPVPELAEVAKIHIILLEARRGAQGCL